MDEETKYCQHYECQCEAAAELMFMSDATGRVELLANAVEIHKHKKLVRCRHVPRRDRVNAPFAPRKEV